MTLAAAQYQDLSRFQNNLKRVYSNKVGNLVPEADKLSKLIPFTSGAEKLGDDYAMPFTMTREGGVTFKGGSGSGGVYQLRQPRATATERALISGCEMTLRSAMSYKTLTSAMTDTGSKAGNAKAFVNATKFTMQRLVKSASYYRELQMLYGGGASQVTNLGVVESNSGGGVFVLTAASWSTAIWAGSEGLEFDLNSAAHATRSTAGTDAAGDNVFKLTSVNPAARSITVTSHATNLGNVVATDYIVFAGAYQQECLGLLSACQTSGAVWGINNSTYYLWKPKAVAVGGALEFEALLEGSAKAAEIGYEGTLDVLVNPFSWQDLANDQAALIRHAEKTKGKVEVGFNEITFYGQTGALKIHSYKYMKQGEALAIPSDACVRVGSTDFTLDLPGSKGEMVRHLENYTGVEIRGYYDQAPFCEMPGALVRFSGIINTKTAQS